VTQKPAAGLPTQVTNDKGRYQALSRVRPDKDPNYERIFIASQFDLKVVDCKIPIPDLRIEYEDDCRNKREHGNH
jgi:hypothetical protein